MTLRSVIAQRVSPIKKRFQIATPIIDEVAVKAEILSMEELALPGVGGVIPYIARGKAYGLNAGQWYRVTFSRSLSEPSIVAVGEARAGTIPSVSSPSITIASVSIAQASVAVPAAVPVAIPTTLVPYINESFPYLISDITWVNEQICKPVNQITKSLYNIQSRINDTIGRINDGFAKTKKAVEDTNTSIKDLRGKAETAINDGLSKETSNVQQALGTTIANTRDSVNKGLATLIPSLYAAWGLPSTMIITPIHIRNVTSTGFEFQSYGKTTCYFIAIGGLK